ncbi:MAG: 2-hydroxyacyl-CoA dehydratase [Deltaproteobacteria bacterium]|nr:2-hydroxyacyl-CoA dehydratase [Deltaproteobacteria bacterium]
MIEKFERANQPMTLKNPVVQELKEAGKRIIGFTCTNFPEEIVYAAGMIPVRAIGAPGLTGESGPLQPASQCFIARANMEMALGEGFSNLDGFVITNTCDMVQNFFSALEYYKPFPFYHFISRPNIAHSGPALKFFRYELDEFRKVVEAYAGKSISDADLSRAISVYNENRRLLKELYDLRGKGQKPLLSGSDFTKVIIASFYMDKETHNKLLKDYIQELKAGSGVDGVQVRVHLSGSTYPDTEMFDIIEELGGMVVSDDLCIGTRYFVNPVNEKINPMDALADRYLNKLACPCMHQDGKLDERYNFITAQIKQNRGQGVIFGLQRFCDTHLVDYQALRYRLEADNIPFLYHEVESTVGAGQLRTKLETFFEIVKGA